MPVGQMSFGEKAWHREKISFDDAIDTKEKSVILSKRSFFNDFNFGVVSPPCPPPHPLTLCHFLAFTKNLVFEFSLSSDWGEGTSKTGLRSSTKCD